MADVSRVLGRSPDTQRVLDREDRHRNEFEPLEQPSVHSRQTWNAVEAYRDRIGNDKDNQKNLKKESKAARTAARFENQVDTMPQCCTVFGARPRFRLALSPFVALSPGRDRRLRSLLHTAQSSDLCK